MEAERNHGRCRSINITVGKASGGQKTKYLQLRLFTLQSWIEVQVDDKLGKPLTRDQGEITDHVGLNL